MHENKKHHFRKYKVTYTTGITIGSILTVFTPIIFNKFNRIEDKVDNIYTLFSEISSLREKIKSLEMDKEELYNDINKLEIIVSNNKVNIAIIRQMIENLENRINEMEKRHG